MFFNSDAKTKSTNTQTMTQKTAHTKVSDILRFSSKPSLNIVIQAEASECGLACVAMLANFHGNYITLDKLRQLNPISIQGSNLTQIMQLGELLSFSCRALKVQLTELNELNTPCILHWNFQHFVVLKKVTKEHCHIADPALGLRKLDMQQVSDAFTGIAVEMQPNTKFKKVKASQKLEIKDFFKSGYWHQKTAGDLIWPESIASTFCHCRTILHADCYR